MWNRFKRYKWWIAVVLMALVLVVLRSSLVSILVTNTVVEVGNRVSPYRFDVVRIRLAPLRFGFQFSGLTVFGADEQPILLIPEGFVGFRLSSDSGFIRKVVLQSPSLMLSDDSLHPRADSSSSQRLIEYPSIQVTDASVQLDGLNHHIETGGLNLTLQNGRAEFWMTETAAIQFKEQDHFIAPFHWSSMRIEPQNYRIQDLNLDSNLIDIHGTLHLQDNHLMGSIESELDLKQVPIHPSWSGEGVLTVQLMPQGTVAEPSIFVNVTGQQFSLSRQGLDRIFHYQMDALDADIRYVNHQFELQDVSLHWAGGISQVQGVVAPDENRVSLSIVGSNQNLYDLGQDLDLSSGPWVGMELDSRVELTGTMSPLDVSGPMFLDGKHLQTAGGNIADTPLLLDIGRTELEGTVHLTKFDLDFSFPDWRLYAASEGGDVPDGIGQLSGSFGFRKPNISEYNYAFERLDARILQPLGGIGYRGNIRGSGRVFGPMKHLATESVLHVDNFEMLGLEYADSVSLTIQGSTLKEVQIDIQEAQKGASVVTGQMDIKFGSPLMLNGQFEAVDAQTMDLMRIFFEPMDIQGDASGVVNIWGPSDDLQIQSDIHLTDITAWGESFDKGRFRLRQSPEMLTIEEVSLERNDGLGSALVRGTRKDEVNNFEVLVGGLPLEYFQLVLSGKAPLRGSVDFIGKIQGTSWIPKGHVRIRDVWYGTQPFGSGSIRITESNDRMWYEGEIPGLIAIDGWSGYGLDQDWMVKIATQHFPLHALYPVSFSDAWVESELTGVGVIEQRDLTLMGTVNVEESVIRWSERQISTEHPWVIGWHDQDLELSETHVIGDGQTDFYVSGQIKQGVPDFTSRGQIDLRVLDMLLEGTRQSTGTIDFFGTYQRDGISGLANINNGFLWGDWFPHPIESLNGSLEVTPQAIQISELDSIVGGGTVSLMGDVHLTGLEATGYDLSMRLEDGRIQLLDWLPPVLGSGDFRINGPTSYPMISGDVEVNAMNFTERIDWEGALLSFAPEALVGASSDEEGYFQYDINMVANNSIRIRNNLADVYASADLKFIGDLATPGMMGTVTLAEQGRALFKERDFSIQKGLLRYEDPYSFDPILDIALKTTVSTPERDVDINYFVTGLYSDWQTHTTSSPSLPQADINALLLFGMTRRDLEADGGLGTALAIEGSDLFVSQFGIVQRFNEAGDGLFLNSEILHLDRIDIISGPTDRNSAYVSSALRLLAEKDIGDGTLRLEQNITDATDVFVSWEQKMTERLYTRLYWSSQQQGRAINGTGALGAEFEVQWELD